MSAARLRRGMRSPAQAAPIDFHFDSSSPYGYFASTKIDALGAKYGREVIWRPFLLGAAMNITGGWKY